METTYGIVSIVPVIILFVLALLTKRTFESLFIATLVALMIGYKGDWFYAFIEQIQVVVSENVWVLLVVGLLGSLICVLERSQAARNFSKLLAKFATTRKKSLLSEWLLSAILFVDDYLNVMTTATTVKRLNDSHKIHRTMTAYVIGSTSAPMVVLVPLTSWTIYFASLIEETGIVPEGSSSLGTYAQSIPFMFYPMICLLVLLLVIAGVIPLFGPIKKYQKQADETGDLFTAQRVYEEEPEDLIPEQQALTDPDVEEVSTEKKKGTAGVLDFVLPIIVLVVSTILLDVDVLSGLVVTLIFTFLLYLVRRLMTMAEYVDTMWDGFSSMMSILVLLAIAFLFKNACETLGMSTYIIGTVAPLMSGKLLPLVIFLVATLMTFALANAWGVAAIMVPLVVPLVQAMDANMAVALAAIFSGTVLGTQLCFYSDNAILISRATNIQPLDHVKTQMPFALVSGVLAAVVYVIYGLAFL